MRVPERGWALLVTRLVLFVGVGVLLTVSALRAPAGDRSDEGVPRVRGVQEDSPQREQQLQELVDRADDAERDGRRQDEDGEDE